MADKYADILNTAWDEIPEPQLLPEGTWLLRGTNVAYFEKDEDKGKDARVVFFYEAKEPMDDVDESALSALPQGYNFADSEDITKQFFIHKAKDWAAVREHLSKHGIETKGLTQKATFDAFKGAEVLAYLQQNEYVDKAGNMKRQNQPTTFAKVQ